MLNSHLIFQQRNVDITNFIVVKKYFFYSFIKKFFQKCPLNNVEAQRMGDGRITKIFPILMYLTVGVYFRIKQ